MYFNKLTFLLSIIAASFSFQLSAEEFDEQGYSLRYKQCMDNSGGVTSDMLACMEEELKVQDKLLNAQYKLAMQSLDKEQQKLLKEGQRSWLNMRENDSQLIIKSSDGSLGHIDSSSLFLDYTVSRVQFLKRFNP